MGQLTITKSEPLTIKKAEKPVTTSDGQTHYVPMDATEAQISALTKAIPAVNAPLAPQARTWSAQGDTGGLALAGAVKALPAVTSAVKAASTNPNAWKVGKNVGQIAGAVLGAKQDGIVGAATGMWLGGKVGWRLTNAAQRGIAAPTAKVLENVAPYAHALKTLSGVQGALDLAQMAEPNRTDIGVLGVGTGEPRSAEERAAHPALINLALSKVSEAVKYLMDQGIKQSEAVRLVMNAKAKGTK